MRYWYVVAWGWTVLVLARQTFAWTPFNLVDVVRIFIAVVPVWVAFGFAKEAAVDHFKWSSQSLMRGLMYLALFVALILGEVILFSVFNACADIHFFGGTEEQYVRWSVYYEWFFGVMYFLFASSLVLGGVAIVSSGRLYAWAFPAITCFVMLVCVGLKFYQLLYHEHWLGIFPYFTDFWMTAPQFSWSQRFGQKANFVVAAIGPLVYSFTFFYLAKSLKRQRRQEMQMV